MYEESNMETYIMQNRQWEFAVCLMEPKQGLWINLEGWDGEGDGREEKKETAPLTDIIRQFCTKEK